MKFDIQTIRCSTEDIIETKATTEANWIIALLRRFKVDPKMIDETISNEHQSKQVWRNFLFEKYGIRIEKNLTTETVVIRRLNLRTFEDTVLGEWKKPEIVRIVKEQERYCELHLKYWNIV